MDGISRRAKCEWGRVSLLALGAGLLHGGVVKEEPPVRTKARRLGKLRWWLLALFLAWGGYMGWREYDCRAAVREAQAAGFQWVNIGPWDLIRADWHNALKKETWSSYRRRLELFNVESLAPHRDLIRRLRPTELWVFILEDENLDVLKGVTSLQQLVIFSCPNLQNLDALSGLTGLKSFCLSDCRKLQNLDALGGLTGLQEIKLDSWRNLQNVDALKNLTGLQRFHLVGCYEIPDNSLHELRAALPNTDIRSQ